MYFSFDLLLPESQRQLDDDYLVEYEERKKLRRQANWYFDEECEDWAWAEKNEKSPDICRQADVRE